jgi:hypothetical protein
LSKLGLVVEDMQAQSALRTLILNMDDYRKIRTDLGKSGGTVEAAFHQREAHDASVAWEGFKGSVSTLAITLGATLLPPQPGLRADEHRRRGGHPLGAGQPRLAHGLMTLVTGFLAGKVALGALQYGFGSILTTSFPLRNGFMMVRTAFMVIGPIIGAIGLWPIVIGAAPRRWPISSMPTGTGSRPRSPQAGNG